MRILINYEAEESNYLSMLKYVLNKVGLQAMASSTNFTSPLDLVALAKQQRCEAVVIVNHKTLAVMIGEATASLDLFRGSMLTYNEMKFLVVNKLAHMHTVPYGMWLLETDLNKLLSREVVPTFSYTLIDSLRGMLEAADFMEGCELIATDIESTGVGENDETLEAGDTLITCCSWAGLHKDGTIKSFVLPFIDQDKTDHWAAEPHLLIDALECMRHINALDIPKVMQNGMYDSMHYIRYGAAPKAWLYDTMALAHSRFQSLPKSLDFLASTHLPDYVYWGEAKDAAGDDKKFWAYNAKDSWYTLRIFLAQLRTYPPYAFKNYAIKFKMVYPALYCNFEGFKLDDAMLNTVRAREQARIDGNLERLRIMSGNPAFNPGSPKQVAELLYDVFGAADPHVGKRKDTKTKKTTKMVRGTNEKNLEAIGEQHPILMMMTSALLEYRGAQKAVSTYCDFYKKNGRLFYSLNPFGTETGRMACSSSSLWYRPEKGKLKEANAGTQVQNIPPYAKAFLVADEDYTLLEPDNSQSEARCVGYLAQEWNLVSKLEQPGVDFYTSLGTLFFGIPYEKVSKDLRNLVLKKIIHGTNYMMGAATFIENAGKENLVFGASALDVKLTFSQNPKIGEVTLKEFASSLLEVYHVPFPKVRQWYKAVEMEIKTTNMLKSPSGYIRYFFEDVSKNHTAMRGAVAHGPQHLSSYILDIGLWKLWELVKSEHGDVRLKAQIHDSAPCQYKTDRPELREKIRACFQNPIEVNGRVLAIPVDTKVGTVWSKLSKD